MRSIVLSFLLLAACGGDDDGGDGGDTPDAGPGDEVDGGGGGGDGVTCVGFDGAWEAANASNTKDTISHDGSLAITASGDVVVAFSEPDAEETFDQDIHVASDTGGGWDVSMPLTADEIQNAYPTLVAVGETLHLTWSGRPGAEINDVFYAANDGGGWDERVNLTAAVESDLGRHAYAPSLAAGPGGALAIAYLSAPDEESGIGIAEVRVALVEEGALADDPVTVIQDAAGCYDPRAIYDGDGNLHVFADCGEVFAEDVRWATDASGDWAEEALPGNDGHDDFGPEVALGPGGAVWVAWTASLPCEGGTCNNILVSTQDEGGFAEPESASMAGTPGDSSPTIAVDDAGRVIVAFHRDNAESFSDVFLTSSDDGASYAAPCNLTRTDASNEWMPWSLQVHPDTGAPHLTFVWFEKDSEPLNTEVFHMRLRLSQ
jgi:hypothetical protein